MRKIQTLMKDTKEELNAKGKYLMFMDRKTQYRQGVSSSQFNL